MRNWVIIDWIMFGVVCFIIIVFSGILCYEFNVRAVNREEFAQKCYNVNGIVLRNATASGKTIRYTYVCVHKDLVIDIKE